MKRNTPDLLVLLFVGVGSLALWLSVASAHVRISTKVTWDREVAPIVQARCVSCHREGGRAPMALTTYEEARPWAKAIKEEVLTRRMPKWHVVRGYGDFQNDPSLSPFEIALIASWADGGSPKQLPTPQLPTPQRLLGGPPVASGSSRSPTRDVTVPCSATRWPAGQLLALTPTLPAEADLRIDVADQPLLWLKRFDPAFAETYRLRRPLALTRQTVRVTPPSADCSLVLSYAR